MATNESAVAAAAAAGSYCDLVDQFLRREEWLRDCAESDKKQAEEALVHERAARLVVEQLLAKEAAAADAAAVARVNQAMDVRVLR